MKMSCCVPLLIFVASTYNSALAFEMGSHEDAKECAQIENENGLASISNSCGRTINFSWRDANYCSTGCMVTVSPGGRTAGAATEGHVDYAACYAPDTPRDVGGDGWTGTTRYQCR